MGWNYSNFCETIVSVVLPNMMVVDSHAIIQNFLVGLVNFKHSIWERRDIDIVVKSSVDKVNWSAP